MNLRRDGGRTLVIGHRGACAVAPENSLESLEAAVAAGADLVEFDVSPGLRLAHSPREVSRGSLALDRALAFLHEHDIGVHLDVKLPGYEREVVDAVSAHALDGRALVSTALAGVARTLARTAPSLPRAIGYPRDRYGLARFHWPDAVSRPGARALRTAMPLRIPSLLRRANANHLALHHTLCSPAAVAAAHRAGAAVLAWTVNDPEHVLRLASLGVDAIVSDDPAAARQALKSLEIA